MSRKVFTCFIVISLFLNKAASYGQEIQVSRDTVKVSVQEGNTSPHNERSITPKPLDIRKAVDLSSGSCPSRITFDVQNPYNPTFPTDKSPLHEGEYSTSGIIKSYPSGYFYGIGRQENFIGLGTMNYAGIGYVYSPGCWSFNLQAYTVKWSVPRRESQLLGLSGLLTYTVNEKIRLNTFASYSFILSSPFSSSNYGGFVSYDINTQFVAFILKIRSYYRKRFRFMQRKIGMASDAEIHPPVGNDVIGNESPVIRGTERQQIGY